MTNALEARALSMSFGTHLVLDHIDLTVADGEFLSIVGPSGCGKTTLLRLLAGLTSPSAGAVLAESKPITGPSRDRAIVFQDYSRSLLPWRSVWTNVALAFEGQGVSRAARKTRSYALLEQMGLAQVGEYFPGQLSGGMQQRVQIARCLAQQPRVMLMDEPFGALDALTRQTLQDEISRLAKEQRITVVFITHDLEEAIYLGDRVVALAPNPGRVAETIDVGLTRPRNQLTTREDPVFLAHRHRLFKLLVEH
ncbi:MAG TPA: ABC transporter ATP-binding protein [Stellaceae bacterium]|jgi:NitT/TauT family transport system ATP-binding protein|nr:ABC transporter ATP-binding protein [Stellaceae bacterium]